MTVHLADLSNVSRYAVRIEFTEPLKPYLLAQEMPYVADDALSKSPWAARNVSECKAAYPR